MTVPRVVTPVDSQQQRRTGREERGGLLQSLALGGGSWNSQPINEIVTLLSPVGSNDELQGIDMYFSLLTSLPCLQVKRYTNVYLRGATFAASHWTLSLEYFMPVKGSTYASSSTCTPDMKGVPRITP